MNFSDKLQILRKNKGLTQEALADKLNVSRQAVAKWESGQAYPDIDELIEFRLEANINTYAAFMNETDSTRLDSHDFRYTNGYYTYHDTYVGGEQFAGEEAIWKKGKAEYAMNYLGRVLEKEFSGDFTWFQGYEEIYWHDKKVYECFFHGGVMK